MKNHRDLWNRRGLRRQGDGSPGSWFHDVDVQQQEDCPFCLGAGTIANDEEDREVCPRCLGAGYVHVFEEMY